MSVPTHAYVVESRMLDAKGEPTGHVARFWTADRAKAERVAAEAPGRTWRQVALEEMPEKARENLLRACAAAG